MQWVIWKLTGGKNEKPTRAILRKKLQLDLYFVYIKHWIEKQSNEICDMSTKGLLIEILCHRYHLQPTKVISGFLFIFITHRLQENFVGAFTVS